MTIKEIIDIAYQNALDKGWWETENIPEKLCLMHSELSEALEEYRNGKFLDEIYYHGDKPEGFLIELADVIIRICSLCGRFNLDLENAIKIKTKYNDTRPYKHGGKLI